MATYYIDLTNGDDDRSGLKIEGTIDSTDDTTHFVDDALTGADDYINGSFFWNVTRSAGSLISDFVAADDEVTLADAIAGMAEGDTYYILDAWLTIGKFAANARSAGDIAKVRANTTQTVGAIISASSSGAAGNPITLKGCDSSDDPWNDASDVRAKLDFNSTTNHFSLASRDYWIVEGLEFANSTAETVSSTQVAAVRLQGSKGNQIINCEFNANKRGRCPFA
jgi:hypothetical protein